MMKRRLLAVLMYIAIIILLMELFKMTVS